MKLISINQAAKQGVTKLRQPNWANPEDHIRIDIVDGRAGPWIHLFSPMNDELHGRNPVDILSVEGRDEPSFAPYTGPA